MTAEVAIMNKEAVALAADSAVTLSERKIFVSVNKIFALSRYNPVGIMIYGSAEFMAMPWEVLIKLYRKKLGKNKFNSLNNYAEDFIGFLSKGKRLFSTFAQKEHFAGFVYIYFFTIKDKIESEMENLLIEKKKISDKDIKIIVFKVIRDYYKIWEKAEKLSNLPENYINDLEIKYGDVIDNAIKNVFEKLPLRKDLSVLLKNIAISLFIKSHERIYHPRYSGIVITGFGEQDLFPSLQSFNLEGFINNYLKYKKTGEIKISTKESALIKPFAQSEMVHSFMEGVTADYEIVIEKYLALICSDYPQIIIDKIKDLKKEDKEKLKKDFKIKGGKQLKVLIKKLYEYRRNTYIDPVINVVEFLPKVELAAMAESLVNLTSFRKRVTIEAETVAGPIDVVVISKGDGFIWIKRKKYFKPELNPQFLARYKKEA